MAKGLKIAEPPRRRSEVANKEPRAVAPKDHTQALRESGSMFAQVSADEKVQFNKRVKRSVSDGYEMLAIRMRKKVPDLLEEALAILEEKYGKV